jgi:DNA-binding Lrp family transcriptional regulator
MDELDGEILKVLKKNSRETHVSIAQRLGTSEGTVRARIKRLVDEGVIKQFTIRMAGKATKALIDVKVGVNVNTSQVASQIKGFEGVEEVYEVSGDYDVVAIADVVSTQELNEIIERMRTLENVLSTRTRLILKEH